MFKTLLKLSGLTLILFQFACNNIHSGVYSYEEAYVANKANDFEFAHFKFFGSDNVIILNEESANKKDYTALCKVHQMDCKQITVDLLSKDVNSQIDTALTQIEKYKGGSFMVVSESPNSTAALLGKFAQKKYQANSKRVTDIVQKLRAEKTEELDAVLGL